MLATACLRDLPDIPAAPEGGTVTGRVLVRDRVSTQLVGLQGASVGITGTSIFASTDERGFFQLPRTPLGSLVVTVTRPYAPGQSRAGRRLDGVSILASGQSLDLGDIELFGSGDITGSVRADADPAAGPGALVIAAQTGYKSIVGLDRAFSLPAMPEGAFDVVAFLPTFDPATHGAVRITANASVRLREIVFSGPASGEVDLEGRVQLSTGEDPSIASVRFVREDDATVERAARVGSDGRFTMTVAPGSYRAYFTAPGHREVRVYGVAATSVGAIGLLPIHLSPEAPGDFDDDGILDDADADTDNDGCANADDLAPRDSYACRDADGDGVDDDIDLDDDNDTLADAEEVSPGLDTWVTNAFDPDTDADALGDAADNCPTVINADQADANADGRGDACATLTSTTPGTPPPAQAAIVATPSLVMPGDRVRFTGSGLDGTTAIRIGDIALEAVTATVGGALGTIPAAISPGVAMFTTPQGEIAGPRLSVLTLRRLAGVGCPPGERIHSAQLLESSLNIQCEDQSIAYDLSSQTVMVAPTTIRPADPNFVVWSYLQRPTQVLMVRDLTTSEISLSESCTGAVLGVAPPFLRGLQAPYFERVVAAYSSPYMIFRLPTDLSWFEPGFCLRLALPYSNGGISAITGLPAGREGFLMKHTTLGFSTFRMLRDPEPFDGQQGDPEFLIANPDGSAWGLGGTTGVALYYPFTSRPPRRMPNLGIFPGSVFLMDAPQRWLIASRPSYGTGGGFITTDITTVIVDLHAGRTARHIPLNGIVPGFSLTNTGALVGYNRQNEFFAVDIVD